MGECKDVNVVTLAGRLQAVNPETLVTKELRTLEVCGTGTGEAYIGYCQRWHWDYTQGGYLDQVKRKRCYFYTAGVGRLTGIGDEPELGEEGESLETGGHPRLRQSVQTIEQIIRARQPPDREDLFSLGVNICEDCDQSFAEYVAHDGYTGRIGGEVNPPKQTVAQLRDYGRHTCQECHTSAFLCMEVSAEACW